nr:phospholipase [Bacillus sp. USDA818B3_A]
MQNKRKRKSCSWCIFPGYNWCGPGCSGPDDPINDVDSCCQKHDHCLSRGGSSCECDKEFMECLRPKINRHTEKGRKAALMYDFMKIKTSFTCGRKNWL